MGGAKITRAEATLLALAADYASHAGTMEGIPNDIARAEGLASGLYLAAWIAGEISAGNRIPSFAEQMEGE